MTVFCNISVAVGVSATISATYQLATLHIESTPPGVDVIASTCYPVLTGVCNTTNWTATNPTNMAAHTYVYPKHTLIGGTQYSLDDNSLTGCNQGTTGSIPNVCSVSVAVGTTATISASYTKTPPLPECPTSAPNLVQNPSFESVQAQGFLPPGQWAILDTTDTEVREWTRRDPVRIPRITDNLASHGLLIAPFAGSKFALMKSKTTPPTQSIGIVGALSQPTSIGKKYLFRAQVATEYLQHALSFTWWLRDSATGADSAHSGMLTVPQTTGWEPLEGTITANANYDRVVIDFRQSHQDWLINGGRWGLIDDVHVCKITPDPTSPPPPPPSTTKPWWKNTALMTAGGAGVGVLLLIGAVTGYVLRRKAKRKKG